MIKAINAGDKNELRKLLKMYSQAIYQRSFAKTGSPEHAKNVTRHVLTYITACAASGNCREDVDTWLMSITDAHAERYMSDLRAKEAEQKQKQSYFTAPTVSGTAPTTNAYSSGHSDIYEAAPDEENKESDEFIPFSPTLTIPERPEFTERHDAPVYSEARLGQNTAAPVNVPPMQAEFTPPQYVPPQYTPPAQSSVMDEINGADRKASDFQAQTAAYKATKNGTPIFSEKAAFDDIVPISLNDEEAVREITGTAGKKKKKGSSFTTNGVLIAVISIILMLVVGVLVAEIVGILVS